MRPTIGLIAHNVHDHGGMERSLAELVRRGGDHVDFHVVSSRLAQDLQGAVTWTRIPVPQRPVPLFFSSFYAAAAAVVPRLDCDLVHTMGAVQPWPVDLASVQFCHRAFRQLPPETRSVGGGRLRSLNRSLDLGVSVGAERLSYRPRMVRHFAAASSGVRRELARHYPGVPATVVPNGFSKDRFDPALGPARERLRAERGYAADDVVAVFLGGDWQRKGLGIALDGVGEAVAAGAERIRLAVVGSGDAAPHRRRAEELGIAARVSFTGRTEAPHLELRAADVFVLPTAYEAFPLVAIEAAAAGLPIVATPVNGIEDLVDDGESGILVAREASSIAAALVRLASDRPGRLAMGAAAAEAAAAYSWDAAAERTLALYDRLLDRRAGGA